MRLRGLPSGWLASLPEPARNDLAAALSPAEARALLYDWPFWARPTQLPPQGNWRVWLLLTGRGFDKTRTGAELMRARVANAARRLALVALTAADARNVMVEGESAILAISPPWDRPRYEPSKRRLTWPNGAIATWCDELGSWRYPEAWDMLMFGLRLGTDPRVVVTTTPRPTKLVRALLADPTAVVTRGSTYENRANLAPAFLDQIIRKYEGTRLGRQEIEAEFLDDVPGARWTRGIIEAARAHNGAVIDQSGGGDRPGRHLDRRRRRDRDHRRRQRRARAGLGARPRVRPLPTDGMGENSDCSLSRAPRIPGRR
jgi:phage terminase large subunit-like protein